MISLQEIILTLDYRYIIIIRIMISINLLIRKIKFSRIVNIKSKILKLLNIYYTEEILMDKILKETLRTAK
jgi:hypothetical protein